MIINWQKKLNFIQQSDFDINLNLSGTTKSAKVLIKLLNRLPEYFKKKVKILSLDNYKKLTCDLLKTISQFTNLEKLSLENTNLTEINYGLGLQSLSESLQKLKNLKTLNIAKNDFYDEDGHLFCSELPSNTERFFKNIPKNIKELNLKSTDLGYKRAKVSKKVYPCNRKTQRILKSLQKKQKEENPNLRILF